MIEQRNTNTCARCLKAAQQQALVSEPAKKWVYILWDLSFSTPTGRRSESGQHGYEEPLAHATRSKNCVSLG